MPYDAFYQEHYAEAYRVASRVNHVNANDAVQDVFFYLWKHPEKMNRGYLLKAVRQRALYYTYITTRDAALPYDWDGPDTMLSPEAWACNEEANEEYYQFVLATPVLSAMMEGHNWTGQERSWLYRNKGKLRKELVEVMG